MGADLLLCTSFREAQSMINRCCLDYPFSLSTSTVHNFTHCRQSIPLSESISSYAQASGDKPQDHAQKGIPVCITVSRSPTRLKTTANPRTSEMPGL